MGPIGLAVRLLLPVGIGGDLSRQIVARHQVVWLSQPTEPNFNNAKGRIEPNLQRRGAGHEVKNLVPSSNFRCAFSCRHTASASG
jgi:hypothetical protein